MKRLLKSFSPEELEARMVVYLGNDERFFLSARHSFGLFVSSINQHAPVAPIERMAPMGCSHHPPCRDDQAHTQRRMQELSA